MCANISFRHTPCLYFFYYCYFPLPSYIGIGFLPSNSLSSLPILPPSPSSPMLLQYYSPLVTITSVTFYHFSASQLQLQTMVQSLVSNCQSIVNNFIGSSLFIQEQRCIRQCTHTLLLFLLAESRRTFLLIETTHSHSRSSR